MSRALLTDGLQRKTLVATRSLGRAGWQVGVADDRRLSLARWSRHCSEALRSPTPDDTAYGEWLCAAARGFDVVLPMDDLSMAAAVAQGARLPGSHLLPTAEQFSLARDKLRTAELAARSGVPHPRSLGVETQADVARARDALGGDTVLRPRKGSGGRGVRFLPAGAPAPRGNFGGHLVQECVPLGRKFDVGLLFGAEGDLRAQFCQEELRWFPRRQDASTLQRSVERPDLVELSAELLREVGWRGLAEVEWQIGAGGTPMLLEVNPRPWASLGLAVAAGVDFPRLWAGLALGQDVRGPEHYRTDLLCRWSLPADALHFLRHPLRGLGQDGGLRRSGERLVDDVIDPGDLGPTFGFALAVLGHAFDLRTWRQVMRW